MLHAPPGPQTIRVYLQDAGGRTNHPNYDYTVNINYYWTSWKYGGADHSVNTQSELAGLDSTLEALEHDDDYGRVLAGLSPSDLEAYDDYDAAKPGWDVSAGTSSGAQCRAHLWWRVYRVGGGTKWRGKWRATSDCTGVPATQEASSALWSFEAPFDRLAQGRSCISIPPISRCTSRGRYTTSRLIGRQVDLRFVVIKVAINPNDKWRDNVNDHPGYQIEDCTPYGTAYLDCTFHAYRSFRPYDYA